MPCHYPIKAYKIGDRLGRSIAVVFAATKGMNIIGEFKVPCGECVGCKLERSRQWAVRCMHESKMYQDNCFITLTYNEENLPAYGMLDYRDFQLFMKRLRKEVNRNAVWRKKGRAEILGPLLPYKKIRFFMCGEYGEQRDRPHFHACIFNFDFADKIYFKTTPGGARVYTSETLQRLWTTKGGDNIGYATVGALTLNSAAYVARYVMKKRLGRNNDSEYEENDMETGEVITRPREFNRMSLKKGIGFAFWEKYKADIFPQDYVIVNGKKTKPPQYYTRLLAKENDDIYNDIQLARHKTAQKSLADNTDERLEVKEKVLIARTKTLKRYLK